MTRFPLSRLLSLIVVVAVTVLVTFAATVIWGRAVAQRHVARSFHVGNPNGVEKLEAVQIGGLTQWIHIRGQDRRNPVLLYLHGGPGNPKIGSQDDIQRPWEDYFTVVQWDQRQTGKSYYPMDQIGDTMHIERMVTDTEEVVQYLRKTLGKDKIFILGHSWGSILGMYLVKRHPEWIYAYIGVGQQVNKFENERIMWEHLWPIAEQRGETAVLARMKAMAPYPDPKDPSGSFTGSENGRFLRDQLNRLAGEAGSRYVSTADAARIIDFNKFISPMITWRDLYNERYGGKIAQYDRRYPFINEVMDEDLPHQLGDKFEVPIFFFTGAHDWHVVRSNVEDWFPQIEAPHKEIVWFEESAHAAPSDEPGKFLVALVEKVLPYASGERVPFPDKSVGASQ